MRTYADLRQIVARMKEDTEAYFGPTLGMVLILLNKGVPTTDVCVGGNLSDPTATVRLLRQLADKIEKEGNSPVILTN